MREKITSGDLFFKNVSGFTDNFYSRLSISKARYKSSQEHDKINFKLPEKAVVEVDKKINEVFLAEFREKYEKLIESESAEKRNLNGKTVSRRIGMNDLDISSIENVHKLFSECLGNRIREYYGCNFRVLKFTAYRHYPHSEAWKNDTEDYISVFKWHLDPFPPSSLKIFIPLTDFKEENGATKYLTREQTRKAKTTERLGNSEPPNELTQEYDVNTLNIKQGQPVIFNPQRVLHRAGTVSEGEKRDLLVLFIIPHSNTMPKNWTKTGLFNGDLEPFLSAKKQLRTV